MKLDHRYAGEATRMRPRGELGGAPVWEVLHDEREAIAGTFAFVYEYFDGSVVLSNGERPERRWLVYASDRDKLTKPRPERRSS